MTSPPDLADAGRDYNDPRFVARTCLRNNRRDKSRLSDFRSSARLLPSRQEALSTESQCENYSEITQNECVTGNCTHSIAVVLLLSVESNI